MLAVVCPPDKMQILCGYMHEKTGTVFDPAMCQGFGIINDQTEFVAGVIISNFREHDCEISCATETSAAWRPTVLTAVFQYIFVQLNCVRCTSIVTKANKKSRGFLKALGFELEGNVRLGYDGVKDALIYGLLRQDCRYLGVN
jgi:RimJ/RimL family protein N-acetyltransferase